MKLEAKKFINLIKTISYEFEKSSLYMYLGRWGNL